MCDILVPWRSLNGFHKSTVQCKKGVDQKRRRLVAEEAKAVTSRAFSAYRLPLDKVPSFKYLGRLLSESDDDFLDVIQNLKKAWVVRRNISRILSGEGVRP